MIVLSFKWQFSAYCHLLLYPLYAKYKSFPNSLALTLSQKILKEISQGYYLFFFLSSRITHNM